MQKDYFQLIESAKEHVEIVKNLQEKLPNNDSLFLKLNMEIRYCLSDLQSALDYFAYSVFMEYEYPVLLEKNTEKSKLQSILRNVSFPHSYSKDALKNTPFKVIKKDYPNLFSKIEVLQPFNFENKYESWLFILNKLANESKHRNFIETVKIQNGFIKVFKYGGLTMTNVTFKNVGDLIKIGGISLTKDTAEQLGATFDGDIETIALFKDSGFQVVECLNDLIYHTNNTLVELERTAENL